jgi:hypothetical protein
MRAIEMVLNVYVNAAAVEDFLLSAASQNAKDLAVDLKLARSLQRGRGVSDGDRKSPCLVDSQSFERQAVRSCRSASAEKTRPLANEGACPPCEQT